MSTYVRKSKWKPICILKGAASMQEARSIEKILEDLKTERSKVDQAISALETLTSTNGHSTRRRWHMSPEARARISKSMKARWKQRKAA